MKLPNAIMKLIEKYLMTLTFVYKKKKKKKRNRIKRANLQMTFRACGQLAVCLPHSNSIGSSRYVLDNWYVQDNKPGFCT